MKAIFLLIFLALALPTGFILTYGTVEDFSTDKPVYHKNDQLNISGVVQYDSDFPFVTIQIFTPGKSGFTDFQTFPVNDDGTFFASFHVGGPTWTTDGEYPIKVTYDGSMEKAIQYNELSDGPYSSSPEPEDTSIPEPEDTSIPEPEDTSIPEPEDTSIPEPEDTSIPEPEMTGMPISKQATSFDTLKFQIPNFPALDKSPQHYIDRYNSETSYKNWFDSQFPNDSIIDVVGYSTTSVSDFPALDKSPQHYIDRYNSETSYKNWFDSQFPNDSIYNILGYEDPIAIPDWVRNNAEWWAIGEVNDSTFVSAIEYMLENNIIRVSNVSSSVENAEEDIPPWIRNSAHWWSQDLISEDEFVNSLRFLIQQGIITFN